MDFTVTSGFEYLNLGDASEAEKQILYEILFKAPEAMQAQKSLFIQLKPHPGEIFSTVLGAVTGGGGQSSNIIISNVSGSHHHVQGHSDGVPQHYVLPSHVVVSSHEQTNGPHVSVASPPQPVMIMDQQNVSQGPQPIRNFYPTGQYVQQPGAPIHVPITAYHSHLAQHGAFVGGSFIPHHPHMAPQQYPGLSMQQIAYGGIPMSSAQPFTAPPQTEDHGQKSHEHSPNSPNAQQGNNKSGYRKTQNRPRRNDEPMQQQQAMPHNQFAQQFYQNPMTYGTVFYNPALAQTVTNVTGPPIIMPPTGQQPQPGMYQPQFQPQLYAPHPPPGDVDQQQHHHVHPTTMSMNSGPPIALPSQPQVPPASKDLPEFIPPPQQNAVNGPSTPVPQAEESTKEVPEAEFKPETDKPLDVQQSDSELIKKEDIPVVSVQIEQAETSVEQLEEPKIASSATESSELESVSVSAPEKDKTKEILTKPSSSPSPQSSPRDKPANSPRSIPKKDNPEFPQLGVNSSNITLANGPGTTAPAVGRSWASIASSRSSTVTNGPANGLVVSTPTNTKSSSISPAGGAEGDGNHTGGPQIINYVPISSSSSDIKLLTQPFYSDSAPFDPAYLSNEDDPTALSLGEFLANYNLNHHSLSLTPRGLSNQSNFCYINATLQSLIACPPFVNLFRGMSKIIGTKPCKATPIIQSVFDFVMEFEPITRYNQNNKNKKPQDAFYIGASFEPTGVRKVLGFFDGATFKVEGRQEDAEEFLSHLLNGLHDEMLKLIRWYDSKKEKQTAKTVGVPKPKTVAPPQPSLPVPVTTNGESVETFGEDEESWQVMGPKNKGSMTRKTDVSKSPISEMFVGQMSSVLNRGGGPISKTTTLQPFFTLQLDIQDDNIHSVRDALEGLSTKEEVSCTSSVNGQEIAMWKQLSLEVLPIILVVHLKRFLFDKSCTKIYKLAKKVDFSVDLEIGKDLLSVNCKNKISQTKQRLYKLFAAVYHDGEDAHKGHYIADTFHPSGGSLWGQFGWIRYDDTAVKGIPESQLNAQPPRVPYLLYYRRVDTLSQSKKVQDRERDRPNFDSRSNNDSRQ